MHLLDRYALSCGVKAEKPFIDEAYYPLSEDNYIVFQTSGKGNSRQYDYWSKVFNLIREYTTDYKIIHVGLPSDQTVGGVDIDLRGRTSIKQLAYVIKNCKMYLGVDSLSTHLAGFYDKKIVSLYSYSYAQNCGPVFGSPENKTLIEVDWKKHGKPSFSFNEKEKKINTIYPEVIARAALKHLGVENDLDKFNTIHIGELYHSPTIEIIPNSPQIHSIVKDKVCNVRMDLFFGEDVLLSLAKHSMVNIITDRQISLEKILQIKPKIVGFTIVANDSISIDYLSELKTLGIKVALIAPDGPDWSRLCAKFFDFCLDKEEIITKNDVENADQIDDTCVFSSEKIIISDGKVYSSKLAWKHDSPKTSRTAKVVDHPDFWEESEHFHIIKDERTRHSNERSTDHQVGKQQLA